MNQFSKIFNKVKSIFTKAITLDDITGGYDFNIRGGTNWDTTTSGSRLLGMYGKSVYVYACVSKIAQKTASIDWQMFRIKNKKGDKQEIFVHPALDLLYKPNPFQTKGQFFQLFMINKKLAGEAFILKVRDGQNKVVELWNLRPDLVTIVKDKKEFIRAFEFETTDGKVTFAPEDIIHDTYPNPLNPYSGMSPLFPASVRVETELNAVSYQKNFFKNNARPDFILSSDGKIDNNQKEEIKGKWEKRHKGAENMGKGAFLEGGLKYQQVSITQREMDYIESLRMTRDDILIAFGVPKSVVSITDDVNLANAETGLKVFLSETIVPEIAQLTEKLNEDLVYPEFGDIFYIKFEDPVPTNEKDKAEVQNIQIGNGTLLINEAREQLGLPPITGGDTLYMPLNMVPTGGKAKVSDTKSIEEGQLKVFRGRSHAMKFLEIRDELKDQVISKMADDMIKKANQKKTKSFILPEIRGAYYDVINKQIDKKGEAYKPAILEFAEGQQKRALANLSKLAKGQKKGNLDDIINITAESELFATISFPFLEEFARTAGEEGLSTITPQNTFRMTDDLIKFIKDRANVLARQINETTLEKLARTLAEGISAGEGINELTERVSVVYVEYPNYRAEMIARTEATAANNAGLIEGYKQSEVSNAKEWISTNDGKTRDSHIHVDGQIVGLNKTFDNGLQYPGDPSAPAGETINCRCVIAPAYREE